MVFAGRRFFLKRDDLLSPIFCSPAFSGNKARKFHYLLQEKYFKIKKIVSHGSSQSNSLYSLSELAKSKSWEFEFYVDHISVFLKNNPAGNYQGALANGAKIISLESEEHNREERAGWMQAYLQDEIMPHEENALFISEGGRGIDAELGVKRLADEIRRWSQKEGVKKLKVALPSGTGTTALYLQKHLDFEVLTCACVGGEEYLEKQFSELSSDSRAHPTILPARKKYHFGKLYREFFSIWNELNAQCGIEFDLLYDPLGWLTLLDHLDRVRLQDWDVIYIHQGGLLGNATMLPRYQRKFG